jgi:predicted acylesterase/phospholipase RssA
MKNVSKIVNIKNKDLTLVRLVCRAQRKRQWIGLSLLSLCFFIIIPGCSTQYAYWNSPKPAISPAPAPDVITARHASFTIKDDHENQDVLLMLALSGGGSRAAYLSARVMTTLQRDSDLDILKEVDVISSVSGGSLAGAYYAVTEDPEFVIPVPRCRLDCEELSEQPNIACQKTGKKQQLVIGKITSEEKEAAQKALRKAISGCSAKEWSYINRLFNLSQAKVSSNRIWISREEWNEKTKEGLFSLNLRFRRTHVEDLMSRDYISRWLESWFWPTNIVRYWFTAYDRTDIMAQTLEDNLFDTKNLGVPLKFSNLNPERPYLIINATDGTEPYKTQKQALKKRPQDVHFGSVFTFTEEDFDDHLSSDIYEFNVAQAVMASAAFPGVFSYVTLKDFTDENDERYHHVFDGGNADNLGLRSLSRVLKANPGRYKHIIVILVDAFVEPIGKSSKNPEPRSTFSHYIDMNFMDSFDALLKINRQIGINEFLKENTALRDKMTFWHITFDKVDENVIDIKPLSNDDNKPDIITLRDESNFIKPLSDDDNKPKIRTLREGLNSIETTLSISDDDKARIEEAVRIIFNKDRPCLERIKKILLSKNPDGFNLTSEQAACR